MSTVDKFANHLPQYAAQNPLRSEMRLPHDLDPEGPDMTVSQLADCLESSERTIYRWLGEGLFPGSYRLKRWHIPQQVVIDYIKDQS